MEESSVRSEEAKCSFEGCFREKQEGKVDLCTVYNVVVLNVL